MLIWRIDGEGEGGSGGGGDRVGLNLKSFDKLIGQNTIYSGKMERDYNFANILDNGDLQRSGLFSKTIAIRLLTSFDILHTIWRNGRLLTL